MGMKKVILVISGLFSLGLLITAIVFVLKANSLNRQLFQSKQLLQDARRVSAHRGG